MWLLCPWRMEDLSYLWFAPELGLDQFLLKQYSYWPSMLEQKDTWTTSERGILLPSKFQQTHSYEGKFIFLLRRISLVLSRLRRRSQKNTLCLFWQEDFYNHRNKGCVGIWPVKWMYALEVEKKGEPKI